MPQKSAAQAKRTIRRKQVVVTQQAIAHRAYELYERGVEGDQLAHWLMAEHELRSKAA
jgi:hypothetical protein